MPLSSNITILGDVHLGKKFVTGVPKHRLGEREEMVWKQFEESVVGCTTPYHVQVGDLFDTFVVPPEVVLRAAEIYSRGNPQTRYITLRGNHDASRDTNKASSFDIFAELVSPLGNVLVVKDTPWEFIGYAFIPWHPFKSAKEQAQTLQGKYEAIFGHFDLESFGGSEHNLIPIEELKRLTNTVVTGHIHTPKVFEMDGVEIIVTGSMQPYSHGEDPKEKMYITRKVSEIEGLDLKNMNVRLLISGDEDIPEIDCLSLILKRTGEDAADDVADINVEFEDFNIDTLFSSCLSSNGVGSNISEQIMSKFQELRNA